MLKEGGKGGKQAPKGGVIVAATLVAKEEQLSEKIALFIAYEHRKHGLL